jgi:hypothetical protein
LVASFNAPNGFHEEVFEGWAHGSDTPYGEAGGAEGVNNRLDEGNIGCGDAKEGVFDLEPCAIRERA